MLTHSTAPSTDTLNRGDAAYLVGVWNGKSTVRHPSQIWLSRSRITTSNSADMTPSKIDAL